ncbi:MAG: SGNH/GDSL hydrolase family protein, partial [Salipiger marinus]|uniref:SGNH/GDSL hydrolase family protein n=1 Tax=Salipiger marinus TaxID=555512 RepID=UPI0040596A19
LVVMMFGTNDQSSPKTKAQFKADTLAMIDRIRAARPTADILLVAPAENNRTDNAIAMAEYAEAYYEIARDLRDVAYLDLQPAFGATPQDYAFGSARPLMNLDGIHPNDTTGSYTILMEIWAMVTRGL